MKKKEVRKKFFSKKIFENFADVWSRLVSVGSTLRSESATNNFTRPIANSINLVQSGWILNPSQYLLLLLLNPSQ